MWKEFKEFAFKGNVLDMAVGVIIGGAFGQIVTSLVNDIIMPAIGQLTGGMNFKDLQLVLATNSDGTVKNAIAYGSFIQNILDFLIIALCIFMIVRLANKLRKPEEAPVPKWPTTEELLAEIRDELKKK